MTARLQDQRAGRLAADRRRRRRPERGREGIATEGRREPAVIAYFTFANCLRVCLAEGLDAVILWPSARSRSLYERHGFAVRDDLFERRLGPAPTHAGAAA
jgi:hypothetical protein